MNYQIMEFTDRFHVIHHVPQSKIDKAMSLVLKAMDGQYGFAWSEVPNDKTNIAQVKNSFAEHVDRKAQRIKLKNQYDKLKDALKLLFQFGTIDKYICMGTGLLKVSFFKGYVKKEIQVIDERVLLEKLWFIGQPHGKVREREVHKGLWQKHTDWLQNRASRQEYEYDEATKRITKFHDNYHAFWRKHRSLNKRKCTYSSTKQEALAKAGAMY